MAEIDIQQMVEDYNNILKENYNEYNSGSFSDYFKKIEERYNKNVEKFKERYGAIEDDYWFGENGVKTKFLSIQHGDKKIILPSFLNTNSSNLPKFSERNMMIEAMFESGYKSGDGIKDIELNSPAILDIDKNGKPISINKGKLTLHDVGADYFQGGNATTSPSETPAAKPEPSPETPAAKPEGAVETPVSTESPQTTHTNTSSKPSYDFNNAKQNMRDEIFGVKEDKEKGIEAKKGIEAEHRSLTDPKKREFRRSSMQDEDVVNTKRFYKAREYYKQNRDRIQAIDEHLNNARASFSEQDQKELLSDKNIKNINKALNEAKAEYDSAVLDAKRAGTKVPEYNSENINKQVAQKVFGNTDIESINAVQYADLKNAGDNLKARFQRRNDIIGRAIDPALERNENKIARGPRAGSSGWGKKAAIFGGVALGALALVGVASMVMSGGRQQNSNLYNPYQAMY